MLRLLTMVRAWSLAFLIFIQVSLLVAQNFTTEMAQLDDFPGLPRDDGSSFSLNGKGYFGLGSNIYFNLCRDFWEFDTVTNSWDQMPEFPLSKRQYTTELNFQNQAFIIGGSTENGISSEVVVFQAESGFRQVQNAPFKLAASAGFTVLNEGFIAGGRDDSVKVNSLWRLDAETQKWTDFGETPFDARDEMAGFSVFNKGYVIGGRNDQNDVSNEVWEFNPTTETWTQQVDFPGEARTYMECASLGNRYAICAGGFTEENNYTDQSWLYDGSLKKWSSLTDLSMGEIRGMKSFVIGSKAYFIGGMQDNFTKVSSFLSVEILQQTDGALLLLNSASRKDFQIISGRELNRKITKYELLDLNGRVIQTSYLDEIPTFNLNLNVESGNYILRVYWNDGRVHSQKIIKL